MSPPTPNEKHRSIDAELLRCMEEAAVLSPHDPQRLALLSDIIKAGAEAEAHWVDLVATDERTRLDLIRVTPPAGLADRLRRLTDEAPDETGGWIVTGNAHANPFMRPRLWATVGIAAAVIFGVSLMIGELNEGLRLDRHFDDLGAMAVAHHNHHGPVATYPFMGSDAQIITASLQQTNRLAFEVQLPKLDATYKLLGAGVCQLGGEKVACTRWTRDGKTYTVYQFCPKNFDMPDIFDSRKMRHTSKDFAADVQFWTEGMCAYALVDDAMGKAY